MDDKMLKAGGEAKRKELVKQMEELSLDRTKMNEEEECACGGMHYILQRIVIIAQLHTTRAGATSLRGGRRLLLLRLLLLLLLQLLFLQLLRLALGDQLHVLDP